MRGVKNCEAQAKGKVKERGGFVKDFMLNKYLHLFKCIAVYVFKTYLFIS